MQRKWAVRPHEGYSTVEYEEALQAAVDLFTHCWRSGGVGTMLSIRVKAEDVMDGGLPGEAFTALFVAEWKDRTDARPAAENTVPVQREETFEAPEPAYAGTDDDEEPRVLVNESDPSEATEEASVSA